MTSHPLILLCCASVVAIVSQSGAAEDPAKPNILLIMADDMGFSDIGSYGGEIDTPNLDRLAHNGLRYSQFYNAARCCPTRASLLTGAYPHQAGMGWMTNADLGTPAYRGDLSENTATIAEVLKTAGYGTYMTGKWHLSNTRKNNAGIKDSWPAQRGFDRFYGIIGGVCNYFTTTVFTDNESHRSPDDFYFTHAIADRAIAFIDDHFQRQPDNPMFMYVAHLAPHWPLHALDEDIEKYRGVYDSGWNGLREERLKKQIETGLWDNEVTLSPRDERVPDWDSLSEERKKDFARRMTIYAAQVDSMDQSVGRIVDRLKEIGQLDNTAIFFLSDNGACAEFITGGKSEDLTGDLADTWESYRLPWANVSSTPFREYKHWVHEGGVRTPLIVHWPKGIDSSLENSFIRDYGHLTDIMATCLELSGAEYPRELNNNEIVPLQGTSLAPHFSGKPNGRGPIFWEHEANIAMRDGNWKLVAKTPENEAFDPGTLELYHVDDDPTELNDLASVYPERLERMYSAWKEWARHVEVYPFDSRDYNERSRAYKRQILQVSSAIEASGVRPNIVVFLSDDHTWRDSSVYGSSDIETPNMERLAAAGMTFERAFVVSPSCAPSRAALLTGLYPANNGAEPNHARPDVDIKKLPAYLQELGYEVVSFGKVGHYAQSAEYGFDIARHYGYHENIAIPNAIEWLRQRDDERPLCLVVGSNWPHVPWPEDIGNIDPRALHVPPNHVDTPRTRQWRARYMAAIRNMDDEIGLIYDAVLETLGEETFFLHSSDHGAQWPFAKWNLYEDGIRTPLIVSWPGRVASGVRTDAMVSWIDFLPTLVDVAGGNAPSRIDGRSFLPVLEGKSDAHRDIVLTAHSGDGSVNVYPIRAARTDDGWKYIQNLNSEFRFTSHATRYENYWLSWVNKAVNDPSARQTVLRYQQRPGEELYHLDNDPYELRNLIGDPTQAVRVSVLREAVNDWMGRTNDAKALYGTPTRLAPRAAPNIVTVFIDDMGWSDLSCFGGDVVQTENIDRLAEEGIRFHNFYVNSPICSPSRVALTTGQYPQRWRIGSYLAARELNDRRGMAQWLDPEAPSLPRELNYAGYATGHFGKWHMGGQRDVGNAPLPRAYGFDRSLANFEGLGPRVLPLLDAYDGQPPGKHDLGSADLGRGPIHWRDRSEITAQFVGAALTFIDQAQATEQPFYLNLWPDDVHSPFFPPKALRDETGASKRELYYAVLDAMDKQLGALFDRIRDDETLRNNTLIVIASDNGHEHGAGSSDPLRGSKTQLYEGGVRSPLIVWGPGLIAGSAAGTIDDESVFCALDLNVSLYAIAGIDLPEGATLDGENLAETVLGKRKASREAPIFWRRPPDRPGPRGDPNPDLAARHGKWKFHVQYDGSAPQLYDLENDISESRNLAAEEPAIVDRLKTAVLAWNSSLPADAGDPSFKESGNDAEPIRSRQRRRQP